MSDYAKLQNRQGFLRLPLRGNIDLTYRCTNHCRHCWLWIPPDSAETKDELGFSEIRKIIDEARSLGCRHWGISGGEPMVRPDFTEIFDYIVKNSASYSINTNGTLITPKIARLMRRKGIKMVALYGATADIHDHITRTPGSFDAVMRGFGYLKKAGANFCVQIVPMKDNYHQLQEMINLAKSLSKNYRIGASWLWLSAGGSLETNREIMRQRLPAREALDLDKPDLSYEHPLKRRKDDDHCGSRYNNPLASCIADRNEFHIDPYGKMSLCSRIKHPDFRYSLKNGSFKECWEEFIPSLADKVKLSKEYKENCGSCKLRKDCRWCPVYGYLEHRDFNSRVEYLCEIANENRKFKDAWLKNHRRYYQIGGITIRVDSTLPINAGTFHPKLKRFEVYKPAEDMISIEHRFSPFPEFEDKDLGEEVYRKAPWAIYRKGRSWIYLGISPSKKNNDLHKIATFSHDYTRAVIYSRERIFRQGNLSSVTLFPTDQILLAQALADRDGCYLHACGVILNGKGLLFVGHSEAGKSTIAMMLRKNAEILCDDRIIVRKHREGFRIHGTWSHGDVHDISSNSAVLKAVFFLEKSDQNLITPVYDKKETVRKLLACLIKPFATKEWWNKEISLLEKISKKVPSYTIKFDKSGEMINVLKEV